MTELKCCAESPSGTKLTFFTVFQETFSFYCLDREMIREIFVIRLAKPSLPSQQAKIGLSGQA